MMTNDKFLTNLAAELTKLTASEVKGLNLGLVKFDKSDGIGAEVILWLLDRLERDGVKATTGDLFVVLQSAAWLIQYTNAYVGPDDD